MNLLEQQVVELRGALNSEMKAKDDILSEARNRIDQYERRLAELKQESDQYKQQSEMAGSQ
jgi:phage shock protein A